MAGTETLILDPALEWQSQTWDKLTLRAPTYGEVMEAKRRGDDGDLYMVSVLSGIPVQALSKLDGDIMFEAVEVVGRFLDRRQLRRGATT